MFNSDLEFFRYTAFVEQNPEKTQSLPVPTTRKILIDVKKGFESEDAAVPTSMLLGFLWDDQEIFNTFADKFLAAQCEELLAKD